MSDLSITPDTSTVDITPPEPQSPAPARDQSGRFVAGGNPVEPPPVDVGAEPAPEPAPPTGRKLKVANDEYDLPDTLDEETYTKVSKTAADLHGAWTRRMQEIADQRRTLEEQEVSRRAQFAAAQEAQDLMAEIKSIGATVKQYESVNWQGLIAQDATLAQQHWINYQTMKSQLDEKSRALDSKKQEAITKQSEALRRAAYDMHVELQTRIPGWSESKQADLAKFASAYGFRPEEISATLDPRAFRVLHDAYLFNQAKQATQSTASQQPKPVPVAKVGGAGSQVSVGLDDKLPTEEWMKRRRAQLDQSRRRK